MNRRSATTTKVFVGSLPPGTTVEELRSLFAPYGEIAECDVVNRCGFLHLEDKTLAFKAIEELNNSTFKGTRISVEKGRVKPPPNRDGPRGARNGYGGPMRGGRDSYRGGPYMREGGGDFDRRGPPRGGGYGAADRGYDRGGYDTREPMMPRPATEGYNTAMPRNQYDYRGYQEDRRYPDAGYGMPPTDNRTFTDGGMYGAERPPYDRRPPMMDDRGMGLGERRPPINDRPNLAQVMPDRRPLLEQQAPPPAMNAGVYTQPGPGYDRRPPLPPADLYSRRDGPAQPPPPPKPMGTVGTYEAGPVRNSGYDAGYNTMPPQRGYTGAPGPRRDMPPVHRY